jgi:hypothetical protein
VLSPSDVRHLLIEPTFAPRGERRRQRRELNERVLDTGQPHHRLGHVFNAVVAEEIGRLVERSTSLGWPEFAAAHRRLTRRIVLGDPAAGDDRLWRYLGQPSRQRWVAARVGRYLGDPDPYSLAGLLSTTPAPRGVDPAGQVPHWLSAFDAVGAATFRALALIVASGTGGAVARDLRHLRACVQESLRLWPTTPVIRRDDPAVGSFVVVSPYFHRHRSLAYADRFAPETWLDGRAEVEPGIVPFGGRARPLPGRGPGAVRRDLDPGRVAARPRLAPRLSSVEFEALPRTSDHTAIGSARLRLARPLCCRPSVEMRRALLDIPCPQASYVSGFDDDRHWIPGHRLYPHVREWVGRR